MEVLMRWWQVDARLVLTWAAITLPVLIVFGVWLRAELRMRRRRSESTIATTDTVDLRRGDTISLDGAGRYRIVEVWPTAIRVRRLGWWSR